MQDFSLELFWQEDFGDFLVLYMGTNSLCPLFFWYSQYENLFHLIPIAFLGVGIIHPLIVMPIFTFDRLVMSVRPTVITFLGFIPSVNIFVSPELRIAFMCRCRTFRCCLGEIFFSVVASVIFVTFVILFATLTFLNWVVLLWLWKQFNLLDHIFLWLLDCNNLLNLGRYAHFHLKHICLNLGL